MFPWEPVAQRARRLRMVSFVTLGVVAVSLYLQVLIEPETAERRLVSLLAIAMLVGAVHEVNRRGHTTTASWIFMFSMVAIVTQRAWITGGVHTPVLALYVLFVNMGGVLLGRIGGLVIALACSAGTVLLVAGQQAGAIRLLDGFASPIGMVVFFAMMLALSLALQFTIVDAFRDALLKAKREIAERKTMQQRLDLALEIGGIGVWTYDVEKQQFQADRRSLQVRGLDGSHDGMLTLDEWQSMVHEDSRANTHARFVRALASDEDLRVEVRTVAIDGESRYFDTAASPVKDGTGKVRQMVGISMDITERKRDELERAKLIHELGERVKELRLLHGAAVAAQKSWASTNDLLQHVVNRIPPAWQYPECTAARITLGEVQVATPGWRETPWRQAVPLVAHGQEGSIEVVYTQEKPPADDGPFLEEERNVLVSLSEMLSAILVSLKTLSDLETLVETRTVELRAARDVAEQAAKAKGTFLAHMSHEIRTPMNAILGYEQLLYAEPGLTDEQRRKLDVIRTSGEHLLTLINDILAVSRLEGGHETLSVQPFDLHLLVNDVRSMFSAQVATSGISLDLHVDSGVPRGIRADPGKVRQVIINLIANALKFTDSGGVRVRVGAAPAAQARCLVSVEVEDTGRGIDPSEFDVIFSPFGQAEGAAARGGTGLGLPISRSFARLMDGDVTVSSQTGRGSTFTFSFTGEVVEECFTSLQSETGVRRRLAPAETRRRVLVVDDVPVNLELLQESLTGAGFETRSAATGEDALAEYEVWRPDLIVMDLHMPGIGGLEALRLLRARGSTTPVIISTASADPGTETRVLTAGAQRLLSKPHRGTELLDAIGSAMKMEFVAVDDTPQHEPTPAPLVRLRERIGEVPEPLVAALKEAARAARAARVIELADEIADYSPTAAQGIRQLADEFRYAALLDMLDGVATDA